jgi:hypothetical protein
MGYQRFQGQLLFLTAFKSNYLKVIASIINLKRIIQNKLMMQHSQIAGTPWTF